MPSLLPTPEPADPVEGQPGHFEHSNWLKASVKALDAGVVHKADTWNNTGTANPAFVPSKTVNGIPYAAPTDPLVQWPATSQSAAERIEVLLNTPPRIWAQVHQGTGSDMRVPTTGASFALPPAVFLGPINTPLGGACVKDVAADGFTITGAAAGQFLYSVAIEIFPRP